MLDYIVARSILKIECANKRKKAPVYRLISHFLPLKCHECIKFVILPYPPVAYQPPSFIEMDDTAKKLGEVFWDMTEISRTTKQQEVLEIEISDDGNGNLIETELH